MKQYFLFVLLGISMVVAAMAFVEKEQEQPEKHLEILLRSIGHQVLLQDGDSSSRVLPVKVVNNNTYRISFGNSFGFTPGTLMNIVHQQLAKEEGHEGYTVSVKECDQDQTVFAYEVNSVSGDLKPCRGREQPKGCYAIEISFLEKKSFSYAWLLLGVVPVGLAGLYIARRRRSISKSGEEIAEPLSNESELISDVTDYRKLGNFEFSESKGMLSINGETMALSEKEVKALSLLAANPNEVVGRDQLMKAIWEDDGVRVMPRNVDVLISKLRKRLSGDPGVKIVNVHGKGYRMVCGL